MPRRWPLRRRPFTAVTIRRDSGIVGRAPEARKRTVGFSVPHFVNCRVSGQYPPCPEAPPYRRRKVRPNMTVGRAMTDREHHPVIASTSIPQIDRPPSALDGVVEVHAYEAPVLEAALVPLSSVA